MKNKEKYLYLSSGKGPAECEWVVMKLLSVVIAHLRKVGLSFEILNTVAGYHKGTYRSVQLIIKGIDIERQLIPWVGTIQWIGKSIYRQNHKRSNWFVRIDILDKESEFVIDENDLEYMPYRASGPGGQHRNKVESAIKVVHVLTKLEAISCDSRSQHQNKVIARNRLMAKVKLMSQSRKLELVNTKNQMNNGLVRGNAVRIFRGERFIEK